MILCCHISLILEHQRRLRQLAKTAESQQMDLETEIHRWDGFARALRKEDRDAFEELMNSCRSYATAASQANRPFLFEPMILSMMLFLQTQINQLEKQLKALHNQAIDLRQENQLEQITETPVAPAIIQTAQSGGGQTRLS